MAKAEVTEIRPQPGPQEDFLSCPADIAFYGGAAGGGKSFALLLEPLRHHNNKRFGAVIFRRTTKQVRNEGGLWDESSSLYAPLKAEPKSSTLEHVFPSGMRVQFAHLEHEKNIYDWQGSQIPLIGFDEVTHFTEKQFFYMMSRNRSSSGVPGYIRATCNPDPDSWVRRFIDWYIGEDGFAIKERSGVIRYFVRLNDTIIWADTAEEIYEKYGRGPEVRPKSFTFISAKLTDNKILMQKDPSYLSNLLAMSRVDRMQLLDGNWNIRAVAGTLFRREWFQVVDAIPAGWVRCVRFWDRAATKPSPQAPDPDWTRGLKMYQYADGTYLVADLRSTQDTPGQVETLIKNTASQDGRAVKIKSQQDPGSAGVAEKEAFIKMLSGYDVATESMSKDKVTRAKPVSAQSEAGNIRVLRGTWNDDFFEELESFPTEGAHDDIVDTFSGAFNELNGGAVGTFTKEMTETPGTFSGGMANNQW